MPEPVRLSGLSDVSVFDRPGQAMQSLLVGDVDSAWRSALSPETLTANERNILLRKWGVGEDTVMGRVLSTITNPGVIASVLLTYATPIPTAKNMFKMKAGIDGMLSKIPILRSFAGPRVAFAGTAVPEILDGIIAGRQFIHNRYMSDMLGPAFTKYEQAVGRSVTAREQSIIFNWMQGLHRKALPGWEKEVGVLMPGLDKAMTQPMRQLATDIRAALDDTRDVIWKDPANREALKTTVTRMQKMGMQDAELEQLATMLNKDGFEGIPDYMPLRAVRTQADIHRLKEAISLTASGADFARTNQYKALTFLGKEFYVRKGGMVPALQELQAISDLVDPQAYIKLQNAMRSRLLADMGKRGVSPKTIGRLERMSLDEIVTKGAKGLSPGAETSAFAESLVEGMPAQYSTKLEPVLQSYYNSVGNTYAWSIKGHGPALMNELNRAKAAGAVDARAAWRANQLENTILPMALGRPTTRQAINSQLWDQRIGAIAATLDRPSVRGLIGDNNATRMKDWMIESQGALSLRGMSHGLSSYFYLATLGLSPGSAFRNHFQSIITTAPLVGFGNALEGQMEAWGRAGAYFEARLGKEGLSHASALRKVYPEFTAAGLAASPMTDDALQRAYKSAFAIQRTAPGSIPTREKVSRAMMAMFTGTETSVRLGAFHAGLVHGRKSGLVGEELLKHGRQVTVRTQFTPTMTDTPMIFSEGGALSNPLLRQLLNFPTKTVEFTLEGIDKARMGDWSQLSRQVAGTYVTMEVGEMLGVNLGDALLGGAFPTFTNVQEKGELLAPLPVVPPAIAIAAGIASSAFSGDWETAHRTLPLMIPGGVALSRGVGFIPDPTGTAQDVSRWMDRKYADYKNPTPTGRIPVYTGKDNLLGFYKPWELVRQAMGIRGGQIDQEVELSRRLVKDAEQMKETRQQYLAAVFSNDPRKMSRIEGEYERRFGHKLAVTQDQIKQAQERRKLTRIERILSTMPAAARPSYGQMAAQSAGAESFLPSKTGGTVTPYTNDLGLLDTLDPYAIGRQRTNANLLPDAGFE